MASQGIKLGSSQSSVLLCPKKGSSADSLEAFCKQFFDDKSSYRRELYREWLTYKAFFESIQWTRTGDKDTSPQLTVRITEEDPRDGIPKPVQNEIFAIIDNEVAKLGRRRSKAFVRANSPEKRPAAKKATEILDWHNDQVISWAALRRKRDFQTVLYGTGILWSFWDTDYSQTSQIASTGAYKCAGETCGFLVQDRAVPRGALGAVDSLVASRLEVTESPVDPENLRSRMNYSVGDHCPACEAPMLPFTPVAEEFDQEDAFGRPMGVDVPIGDAGLDTVSPFEIYFDNEGIGVDPPGKSPKALRRWGRQWAADLDWIAEHYGLDFEDGKFLKDGEEVKPANASEMAQKFPVLGEWSYWGQGAKGAGDRTLFRHHALVRTYCELPSLRHPAGRLITMAGRVVLEDDDFCFESRRQPGVLIPKVKLGISRFSYQDNELFGMGIAAPLISPQRRLNMLHSQVVGNRESSGTDMTIVQEGQRLERRGWAKNLPGAVVELIDPNGYDPSRTPQFVPARLMSGWENEANALTSFMQRASGGEDVDLGRAPKNVSAATAIQLLQEAVATRRDQREQELKDANVTVFSHKLVLLAEKVLDTEKKPFRRQSTQNNDWEMDEFTGSDLAGLTEVVVEDEPSYDLRAFEREGLVQGINMGLYTIESEFSKRETIKAMGLPLGPAAETNVQIEDAERKWAEFKDHGKVPVLDNTADSHNLFYQTYGRYLKSEAGIRLAEESGWNEIVPLLWPWEEALAQADQMEMMAKAPPQPPDPNLDPQAAAQIAQINAQTQAMMQQQVARMNLPKYLPARIYAIWNQALQEQQAPPLPQHSYFKFRATFEAHRILAQTRKAAAMAGGTVLASPGGGSTPEGLEPVPGQGGKLAPPPGGEEANPAGTPSQMQPSGVLG